MQGLQRAAELGAQGIGKTYGDFHALSDISLTIGRGEFLTLLGPSGSGKTTFLMILAGFVHASSGRLSKDGSDITGLPAEKRGFGMVFQGYALFPHMTVEKNIAFPLEVQGRDAATIKARVNQMIDTVGLRGHERKRPSDLSGGQQQRVAIARALAPNPSVLLLDEPTSALDPELVNEVLEVIRRLAIDDGLTMIISTHQVRFADEVADRVAFLNGGVILEQGPAHEVLSSPRHPLTARFLSVMDAERSKDAVA